MYFDVANSSQQSQNSQQPQRSPKSQDSFDMSDIDDLLDLHQQPIFDSPKFAVRSGKYVAQLNFSRISQMIIPSDNNSNIDSGFDSTQSSSFVRIQPDYSSTSFGNDEVFPSQSFGSINATASNADEKPGLLNGSTSQTDEQHFLNQDELSEFSQSNSGSCSFDQRFSQNEKILISGRQLDLFGATSTPSSSDTNAQNDECNEKMDEIQHSEEFSPDSEISSSNDGKSHAEAEQSVMNPEEPLTGLGLPEIEPILKLFSRVKSQNTDCAFVSALAANMCKDIYPKHSNISLKTALLLSIVSCNVNIKCFSFFRFVISFLDLSIFRYRRFRLLHHSRAKVVHRRSQSLQYHVIQLPFHQSWDSLEILRHGKIISPHWCCSRIFAMVCLFTGSFV